MGRKRSIPALIYTQFGTSYTILGIAGPGRPTGRPRVLAGLPVGITSAILLGENRQILGSNDRIIRVVLELVLLAAWRRVSQIDRPMNEFKCRRPLSTAKPISGHLLATECQQEWLSWQLPASIPSLV
jgi:hypothetical protein